MRSRTFVVAGGVAVGAAAGWFIAQRRFAGHSAPRAAYAAVPIGGVRRWDFSRGREAWGPSGSCAITWRGSSIQPSGVAPR